MTELTDAEVVCEFMEARPTKMARCHRPPSDPNGWWKWRWSVMGQQYRTWPNDEKYDSLDGLHLVEAKIMAQSMPVPAGCADWGDAIDTAICDVMSDGDHWHFHATAEQKLKALAAVLRGAGAAH